MCPKSGGDPIGVPSLSIGCKSSSKWLNIVLDLSGVLCQCVERSSVSRHGRTFREDQHVHSSRIPTLVGPKGVYVVLVFVSFCVSLAVLRPGLWFGAL